MCGFGLSISVGNLAGDPFTNFALLGTAGKGPQTFETCCYSFLFFFRIPVTQYYRLCRKALSYRFHAFLPASTKTTDHCNFFRNWSHLSFNQFTTETNESSPHCCCTFYNWQVFSFNNCHDKLSAIG